MKALVYTGPGALDYREVEDPRPQPGESLLRDILMRLGHEVVPQYAVLRFVAGVGLAAGRGAAQEQNGRLRYGLPWLNTYLAVHGVLPAAVVRRGPDGAALQLFVRTRLMDERALTTQYTPLSPGDIRAEYQGEYVDESVTSGGRPGGRGSWRAPR